jgi:hypothetical protein
MKALDNVSARGVLDIETFKNGRLLRSIRDIPNKVVSSSGYGRNLFIRQLAGDTTYPLTITTISLGDGAVAPADGNTALGNSLVSGLAVTEYIVANNVLTIKVFAPDGAVANDTYSELGVFCGTRLFARILIAPAYTKDAGEDTLFTYTLTIAG